MMTIASSTRRVVKQALKWMALAGAVLVMGQAPALAEDSVCGADETASGRHGRESGHNADRGLYAGSRIRPARPSGFGVRLRLEGTVVTSE